MNHKHEVKLRHPPRCRPLEAFFGSPGLRGCQPGQTQKLRTQIACQLDALNLYRAESVARLRDRKGTTKNLRDRDLAEVSGALSGAIFYTEQMDAAGLGRKLLLPPPPRQPPVNSRLWVP